MLARKRKPSTKQSVFERSDFVCSQGKAEHGRTTCSCQSLATRHCKISAPTCGSQEFYRADRESKHHQRKPVLRSAAYSIGSRCGGQRRIQRCHNQISFSFQAQQHQFHDDLPGRSSNPFQTAATDFTNDRFIRSYLRLFTQTGQYYRDTGNAISREQYKDGCALFAFDLTPQMDSSEVGFELIKHGNIRIEIHFATATARTLTVIVFAENDNLLEIDQDRNVAFDYTA